MKKALILFTLLMVSLLPASLGFAKETIRVGVITPLTGDVKTYGESTKNSFMIALEDYSKSGKYHIVPVIADDRNDPTEGANAALKLITQDKVAIEVLGNIELPEEMQVIRDHGAQGIGLFRSEFLFMDKFLPNEEKQLESYRKVVEAFHPLPVTIRTIDVGGDKVYALSESYKERNPFLGCRAIRFSLSHIPMFKTQLRAILRASAFGKVKLMFPMISTAEEVIRSKELLEEAKESLRSEGLAFDEKIPVGIMIEVPSAALNADRLAKHSDFFSVGTNDLVQYMLAVDRIGEKVAYLYKPVDLSILRILRHIAKAGKDNNTPLSICGEIAGEPKYTMLLLGLGFRTLSMSSAYMFQVKKVIRSVRIKECEKLVEKLLSFEKTSEADNYLNSITKEKFPFLAIER